MKSRQLRNQNGERTFVLVYEPGEAFQEPLVTLAQGNGLGVSLFTAIGAFRKVTGGPRFGRSTLSSIRICLLKREYTPAAAQVAEAHNRARKLSEKKWNEP